VAILKQIRILKTFKAGDFPPSLEELHSRDDQLFVWVQALHHVVSCYNEIVTKCLPVELALIEEEMDFIDSLIEKGIQKYDWNMPGKVQS